ncbi:MAG: sterol desaturase family protein [Gammaproteobacteria bacterium]|nr:sterol desaturase family protein [Gammaproteobacteria bacterium]
MELDLDGGRLAIFLGGLLFFILLESLFPARAWQSGRTKRTFFHVTVATFNTLLVRIFIYVPFLLWVVYVEQQGWGISRWLGLNGWLEIILSLVVLDAFDYFWHRANHRIPFLWRFHKAHHADTEMDVTTALRFHPGELVLSSFAKAGWVLVWGPTPIAWFIFEGFISLCAQFHHSNIDFPDRVERPLARVIVTPRFHTSHHAVDRRYGDANFSTIFSFWDPLFKSYNQIPRGSNGQLPEDGIGLPEARELSLSFRAWFTEPFSRRNMGLPD